MIDLNKFEVLTFDCYGTLIDWGTGILTVLKKLLVAREKNLSDRQILQLFAEFEAEAEGGEYMTYREVMKYVVKKVGERLNFQPTQSELNSLWISIKDWQPFPDTIEALQWLKQKYKLGVISNIDDEFFAASAQLMQVEFDFLITAQQAKSYKPSLNNFKLAFERIGISTDKILHVAQSIYHDIIPAKSMGLSTVWVNRQGLDATLPTTGSPDIEVPDMKTLVAKMREK